MTMKPFECEIETVSFGVAKTFNPELVIRENRHCISGYWVTEEEFNRVKAEMEAWYANGCEPPEKEWKPNFKVGDFVTVSEDVRNWPRWGHHKAFLLNGKHKIFEAGACDWDMTYGFKNGDHAPTMWIHERYLTLADPPVDHTEGGKYRVFEKGWLHPMYQNMCGRLTYLESYADGKWADNQRGLAFKRLMYRVPVEQFEKDLTAYKHCKDRGLNMEQIDE